MSFVCDVTVLNSSAVHHCRGTERQETQQNDSWQTLAVSVTDVRSHSAKWLLAVYTLHRRRRGRSSCWPSGMRLLSIVMYTRHVVTSNPFMLLRSSAERLRIVQLDGIRRRRSTPLTYGMRVPFIASKPRSSRSTGRCTVASSSVYESVERLFERRPRANSQQMLAAVDSSSTS